MLTCRMYVRASAKKVRDIKHIASNTVIVQRHPLKFVSVQHNLIEYNFIQFSYNLIKNDLFGLISLIISYFSCVAFYFKTTPLNKFLLSQLFLSREERQNENVKTSHATF